MIFLWYTVFHLLYLYIMQKTIRTNETWEHNKGYATQSNLIVTQINLDKRGVVVANFRGHESRLFYVLLYSRHDLGYSHKVLKVYFCEHDDGWHGPNYQRKVVLIISTCSQSWWDPHKQMVSVHQKDMSQIVQSVMRDSLMMLTVRRNSGQTILSHDFIIVLVYKEQN